MADTKISNLTALAEAPATTDEFVLVDKSDTTMAASGTDKRITFSNLSSAQNVDLTVGDGINVVLNGTTGTKIGTATSQKLGFFNAAPVVQQTSTADLRTALVNLGLVATGGANPLNLNGGALTTTGVSTFGDVAASTAQIILKGGASGGAMFQMQRTTGTTVTFSWNLAGSGLGFQDDTGASGATVLNILGDSSKNQLYVGQKGKVTSDTRTHLLAGTSFGAGAGTDVAGQKLQIQTGVGTGAGAAADIEFLTGVVGSTGTTPQTPSVKFAVTGLGSVVAGSLAALATNATDGFLYIPTCAGTPSGTPTAKTGKVALVFDTTGNKLWAYDAGWIGVVLA